MNTSDLKINTDTSLVNQGIVRNDADLESFLSFPHLPRSFTEYIRDIVDERDLN